MRIVEAHSSGFAGLSVSGIKPIRVQLVSDPSSTASHIEKPGSVPKSCVSPHHGRLHLLCHRVLARKSVYGLRRLQVRLNVKNATDQKLFLLVSGLADALIKVD